MGTYIAQSDIEDVFGVDSVAAWSQLDPDEDDSTADTARIAKAIAYAERTVEDRFRNGRYAVPFSGTSVVLVDWCAKLAGVWLYSSRGVNATRGNDAEERIMFHRRAALEEMDLYLSEQRDLGLTLAHSSPDAPTIC